MGFRLEVDDRLGALGPAVRRSLGERARELAEEVALEARRSILFGPKTGRTYGGHRASAPGEAPASETGELADSIEVQRTGPLSFEVVVGAPYGPVLEFGGARVAPRPFLGPAFEEAEERLAEEMLDAVQDAAERVRF